MSVSAGYSHPRNPFAGAAPLAYRPLSAIAATTAGGVPQGRIKRVLAELVAPLQALHDQGLIRGDISMHSVGLDETGRAHLINPGGPPYTGEPLSGMPEPGYAPPELYAAGPQWPRGPWTDIYALSAVAHSLVTGTRPPSSAERVADDPYRPLAGRELPKYDVAFLHALDVSLAVDPRDRPQTLQEFTQLLDIPAAEAVAAVEPHAPPPPPVPPTMVYADAARPGVRTLLLGLLVLAVGIGVAAYWWNRLASPPVSTVITRSEVAAPGSPQPADPASRAPRPAPAGQADGPAPTPAPPPEPPGLATLSGQAPAAAEPEAPSDSAQVEVGQADTAVEAADASAPPPPITSPVPWVRIRIDIQPWGEIWIDGVRRGVSPPLKELRLPPGQYSVLVRNANLPPYRGTLTVREGRPTVLSHTFQ